MLQPQFKTTAKNKIDQKSVFVLEPLEKGYGHTLGNALRRCLLSSIQGRAITSVKIDGVKHQFSTLSGLKEDVIEFILNLKQVVVKSGSDEPITLKLDVKGPKIVKAGDIKTPAGAKIINKDLVLANLSDKKSVLNCEIVSETGFGYSVAEERKSSIIGLIPVDAAFSPVLLVNYQVESARVGRKTDFDRLIIEVTTNGSVEAEEVLHRAARTLTAYFKQVYNPIIEETEEEPEPEEEENSEVLNLTVEELDLPTRIANALRRGGFSTVRSIVNASKDDISKVKNLGSKSLKIINEKLATKGVTAFAK